MAFSTDDTLWREFLQVWPLERLREMTLAEYTTAGDKDCFVYWLEFRLVDYGSIAGVRFQICNLFPQGNGGA